MRLEVSTLMKPAKNARSMTFRRISGLKLEIYINHDIIIQLLFLKTDISMLLEGEIV
jgi:hypothetical protein